MSRWLDDCDYDGVPLGGVVGSADDSASSGADKAQPVKEHLGGGAADRQQAPSITSPNETGVIGEWTVLAICPSRGVPTGGLMKE